MVCVPALTAASPIIVICVSPASTFSELSGDVSPPAGKVYASHVRGKITFPDLSHLAQSDDARDLPWREGAAIVGLLV